MAQYVTYDELPIESLGRIEDSLCFGDGISQGFLDEHMSTRFHGCQGVGDVRVGVGCDDYNVGFGGR